MNKLGTLLASAVLLTSVASVQVHAADNLDITKTPYKLTLHESATVVIPWNADYSWELAAAQGGGVDGINGSLGGVIKEERKRLKKNARLSINLGRSPTTGVSTGGGLSSLSVDDSVYAIAGGGAGNVPSYAASDKVSPTSAPISIAAGYGSPNGSNGYVRYHTHTGQPNDPIPRRVPANAEHPGFYPGDAGPIGCYIGHLHGKHDKFGCEDCKCSHDEEGNCIKHNHPYKCGKKQGWYVNCGKEQGDIDEIVDATPGVCTGPRDATVSYSNQGDGYFVLELCEHSGLSHANTKVRLPYYRNDRVRLLIVDDTVVYYAK